MKPDICKKCHHPLVFTLTKFDKSPEGQPVLAGRTLCGCPQVVLSRGGRKTLEELAATSPDDLVIIEDES